MPPQDAEQAQWFESQVRPHEPRLRSWLRSRFGPHLEVDDILQESYVRILAARERGQVEAAKAFLFAVARNLAIDRLRKERVNPTDPLVESDQVYVLDHNDVLDDEAAHSQKLAIFTEAIQALPSRCRRIFTLRKVYGLSQKEIAKMLDISEHTVSAQLTIGFNKCAQFVARRKESDSWRR